MASRTRRPRHSRPSHRLSATRFFAATSSSLCCRGVSPIAEACEVRLGDLELVIDTLTGSRNLELGGMILEQGDLNERNSSRYLALGEEIEILLD